MSDPVLSFSDFLPTALDAVARGGIAHSQARLAPPLRAIHQTLLRQFLTTGQAPTIACVDDLALPHGVDSDTVIKALADADLVHFNPAGDRVEIAYPLSAKPSPHQVYIHGGALLTAMCAIDALGIPFMARTAVTIASNDPGTGQQIRVTRDRDGSWNWEPATTAVVLAAGTCAGPIAYACLHTEFHATPALAEQHLARHPQEQGRVLTRSEALSIAETEFGPLLSAPRQ